MKQLLFSLCFLLGSSLFAQMTLEEFYDSPEDLLVYSKVYEFDSLPSTELSKRLKNWAGTSFVNSREVIVSETEDQMVLVYSFRKFFIKVFGMRSYMPWYIRLVVQIKDNKIRCLFYDDGNVFIPGSYSGGVRVPSTPSRLYRFKDYMRNGVSPKKQNEAFTEVRAYVILTGASIAQSLRENSAVESLETDW